MTSMTSEMASLDSSIPPSTHCSAATSCGGVRSNSPPRGTISATLTRLHLLAVRRAGLARGGDGSVLADEYDSLPALAPVRQLIVCTALWTVCEDTPAALCTAWGRRCDNRPADDWFKLLTCNNDARALCVEQ